MPYFAERLPSKQVSSWWNILISQKQKWIACFQSFHEAAVACDGHDIWLVHGKCKTEGYVFIYFLIIRQNSYDIPAAQNPQFFYILGLSMLSLYHFRLQENF
jgi:hypothetical protein